jgi:hypothetical protein
LDASKKEHQLLFGHHKQINPLGKLGDLSMLKCTYTDLLTLPLDIMGQKFENHTRHFGKYNSHAYDI